MRKITLMLTALLMPVAAGFGQVPSLMNYQGYLTDPATGLPVPDSTYQVQFSIYNTATGGTAIWSETYVVETINGLYSVQLGSTTPLTPAVFSGTEKYLGLKVGADPEMAPRKQITSVAYALKTEEANLLDGKDSGDFAASGHDHSGTYYTKTELNTSDGDPPNTGSNRVSWDNLADVPAGFADGVDDGGGGLTLPFNGTTSSTTAFQVTTSTTASSARAISGIISSTSPGGFSAAVRGENRGTGSTGIGVYGSQNGTGLGVYGIATNGRGVYGTSSNGVGVFGEHSGSGGANPGVRGETSSTSSNAAGVYGIVTSNASGASSAGVRGINLGNTPVGEFNPVRYGVWGTADAFSASGVFGDSDNGTGVRGESANGTGVFGTSTGGHAGFFSGKFRVVRATNSFATIENHVAIIENTSFATDLGPDVLAIKTSAINPTAFTNLISFFQGNNAAIGRIEGNGAGGVAYVTTGGDYAEALPRLDPGEHIEKGDIVGVFAGKVSKRTTGAQHVLVVSSRPAVVGNLPPEEQEAGYEKVAFLGQVQVRVRGPVQAGDFILASGKDDGTGVAVAPERIRPDQLERIVGRAWQSSDGQGVKRINAAVGLPFVLPARHMPASRQHRANGTSAIAKAVPASTSGLAPAMGNERQMLEALVAALKQVQADNDALRQRIEALERKAQNR
jgi:hypothetical protein